MKAGKSKDTVVVGLVTRMLEKLQPDKSDAILESAIQDIRSICEMVGKTLSGESISLELLDGVMAAQSGAKQLVSQTICQVGMYKQAEATSRRRIQNAMIMNPELAKAATVLESHDPLLEDFREIVKKLTLWEDSLGAGRTLCLATTPFEHCCVF